MAVINQVGNALTGSTGTGAFVGATSPTLVTPTLGAATATTVTFSPTTGGIVGTTTNNNTDAGNVGEFVSSTIAAGSAISLTTTVSANITSISLTAGDWDVWGTVLCVTGGASTLSRLNGSLSTTSATQPAPSADGGAFVSTYMSMGASLLAGLPCGQIRLSLSGTTTVYLVVNATFTSTATAYGYIAARRVR